MSADWTSAPCRGRTSEFVFDTDETRKMIVCRRIDAAKAVCAGCHLRAECLDRELEAMRQRLPSIGVYGGLTQQERRRLVERRPPHGSDRGYAVHLKAGERPCDDCRRAHNRSQAVWKANNRDRLEVERRTRRWMVETYVWFVGLKVRAVEESWRLRMEGT